MAAHAETSSHSTPHSSGISGELRVVVVTPEQTVLDATSDFVALPLFDGELGVAPGHAPMIGRLGYGELRIGHGEGQRYYIDGGFVQVVDNVVSVLTNRAIAASTSARRSCCPRRSESSRSSSSNPRKAACCCRSPGATAR